MSEMQDCGGFVLLFGLWQLSVGITAVYRRKSYDEPRPGSFKVYLRFTGTRAVIAGTYQALVGLLFIFSAVSILRDRNPLNTIVLLFCGPFIGILLDFMLRVTQPKTKNERPITKNQ